MCKLNPKRRLFPQEVRFLLHPVITFSTQLHLKMPYDAGEDGPHLEPCKAINNPLSQHRIANALVFPRPVLTFFRDNYQVPKRTAVKRLFGRYGNAQGDQGAIVLARMSLDL